MGGARFGRIATACGIASGAAACAQIFGIHEQQDEVGADASGGDGGGEGQLDGGADGGCGSCDEDAGKRCIDGVCTDREQVAWKVLATPACDPVPPDGVLRDSTTGLMWQAARGPTKNSVTAAEATCRALRLDGFDDWTLPTMIELASLAAYAKAAAFDTSCAESPPLAAGWYCSRTPNASGASTTWYALEAPHGDVGSIDPGQTPCSVRCVRPTRSAPSRFSQVSDGIYDAVTDLTWQARVPRADAGSDPWEVSFGGAASICTGLPSSGKPWRVPRVNELVTLLDVRQSTPALDRQFFDDEDQAIEWFFWTDTTYAAGNGQWWTVDFITGNVSPSANVTAHVRCVHDGRN